MNDSNKIELYIPKVEDYWYEEKVLSDPKTMEYNKGYEVSYNGYHYDTGCIDFPKSRWEECYNKRIQNNKFFAYIKDIKENKFVGYVNYHYNESGNKYECGVVIEDKYRGKGYAKKALILLCCEAFFNSNIDVLYDSFEKDRKSAFKLFESIGFKIVDTPKWKKFKKDVEGIIICLTKRDFSNTIESKGYKI